jgi:ribose 5-phosphate isomerase B
MRFAIGSDDVGPLTDALLEELERRGAPVERFGALRAETEQRADTEWASIGRAVGEQVAGGRADVGIVCCWTGTGISIAANKVRGVRAALCGDAVTAEGARRWNDANVLALSLRATTPAVGLEILAAFLATAPSDDPADRKSIAAVEHPTPDAHAVERTAETASASA